MTVNVEFMAVLFSVLKYEGEDNYRYLAATDVSWRHDDVARLHALRWLIEVLPSIVSNSGPL